MAAGPTAVCGSGAGAFRRASPPGSLLLAAELELTRRGVWRSLVPAEPVESSGTRPVVVDEGAVAVEDVAGGGAVVAGAAAVVVVAPVVVVEDVVVVVAGVVVVVEAVEVDVELDDVVVES